MKRHGSLRQLKYFHTTFKEHVKLCPDGTSNYITADDSDGVQIIIL